MRNTILTAAFVATFLAGAGALAGEPGPETLLPMHEERDASMPGAAFGRASADGLPSSPSATAGQAAAASKGVFLVVWQSGRLAPGDLRKGLVFNGDIVGCRLDKSGQVLDAKPFVICGAKDLQDMPKVAFGPSAGSGQGNGVFLVVWQDLRTQKDWDVYAARVTPDGKVLDPDGMLVSGGKRSQGKPRAAWDGQAFQVVWMDIRSGKYEIRGARVSADGKLLDAEAVVLGPGTSPVIASVGPGKCQVIWAGGMTTGARCLMADGKMVPGSLMSETGPYGKPGPSGWGNPTGMAAGSKGALCVWRTNRPVTRGGAYAENQGCIFSPEGKRTKEVGIGGTSVLAPEVAWDGSQFVVGWNGYFYYDGKDKPGQGTYDHGVGRATEKIRCSFITPEGELRGAAMEIAGTYDNPVSAPAVASDEAGTTLIAYEKHPDKGDIPIKIGVRMLTAK